VVPHLETLPEAQKLLYPTLAWTKAMGFVLYNGTTVALYCGHRESKDFDFFTESSLDKEVIRKWIVVK